MPTAPTFVELPTVPAAELRIEIAGTRLHVPASVDEETLRLALRVLREAP